MKPRNLLPGLAALGLLAFTGCVDEYVDTTPGLSSFQVAVVPEAGREKQEQIGSEEEPLPVPRGLTTVHIGATAWDSKGEPFPWNGRARVKVTPGRTVPNVFPVEFRDGVAEAEVDLLGVHSDTRIWVIDDVGTRASRAVGVSPILHYESPSLADINTIPPQGNNTTSFYIQGGTRGDFVRMEREGVVYADRSDPADACEWAAPGPAARDMIVTAVTSNGFYVTDLSEPADAVLPGNWGHIYVYNFGFPEGLQVGDRLHALEGTIQEFSGNTQITFPEYRISSCPLVAGDDLEALRATQRELELAALTELETEAAVIDADLCTGGSGSSISLESCGYSTSNLHMESLESALVVLPEVKTPEMWVRCDFDGDGESSNHQQIGSAFGCLDPNDAECACNLACQTGGVFPPPDSPMEATHADRAFDARGRICSELTSYNAFGQYIVRLVENGVVGPRINVSTRDAFPDFDPEEEENLGSHLRVRGNLVQVRAARPRWVVQARIPDERNAYDICCTDEESCPVGLSLCE